MQIIEADYNIVTPMFIGGGDKQEAPEIRPPSIKGALRFWWRALQWGDCLNSQNQDVSAALIELHKQEAVLFGAAAKDEAYGQGKVLLKVKVSKVGGLKFTHNKSPRSPSQAYLLGQGLYHFKKYDLHASITANQSFKVVLKLHDDVDASSIKKALLLFGLLGGLGSRARRGWGSVAIKALSYTNTEKQIEQISIPHNKETFKHCLSELLTNIPTSLPPFTAFSQLTQIHISEESTNAEGLLTSVGAQMQRYRSYGKAGGDGVHKVNGQVAEQNFKNDHDLVYDFANKKPITKHPHRVVFGLPHNYFLSGGNTQVDVNGESFSRRASPLLIHIHQFPNGDCIAVHTLLTSQFLPQDEKIELIKDPKVKPNYKKSIPCDIDWKDITNYLERFNNRERIV